ncbi:hypothetical protein HNR54_000105 [Methanothermobacter sp. DSM 3267]
MFPEKVSVMFMVLRKSMKDPHKLGVKPSRTVLLS